MAYEPRLIAPFDDSGLKKWYKPWIIGKTAFPEISNAYARRGVIRKREGYRLLAALPGGDSPVQGLKNYIDPASLGESLVAFSRTKAYLFNDGSQTFNDITFYAYPTGGAAPITGAPFSFTNGTNDYFWSRNFASSMWVTNNLLADHIKYWNGNAGALNVSGGWSNFQPIVRGGTPPITLNAALIVIPYKGRLVALNTQETFGGGSALFQSRARWSQLGTPYAGAAPPTLVQAITLANPTSIQSNGHGLTTGDTVSFIGFGGADADSINLKNFPITRVDANNFTIPLNSAALVITVNANTYVQWQGVPPSPFVNDINAWRDDIPGKGGFVDADTSERIVSCDIIKDTLIVFFQRSTWRLRYTGNEVLPFIWERLNTQYGSESTYSSIAFDEAVLSFSRYGWIASDTNDVARIDQDIPDNSFSIEATNVGITGLNKIQGIRDFYRNFAYWTFMPVPQTQATQIYGYNYLDKNWTIFTPTQPINVFGTYRKTDADNTWASFTAAVDVWENFNSADSSWSEFMPGNNIDFPYIVGGDTNGNVYIMFEFSQAPGTDYSVAASGQVNFDFSIITKRFNPYIKDGMKCRLGYVDLYCTTVPGGEITVNHYVDDQEEPVFTRRVPLFSRGVLNIIDIIPGVTTSVQTDGNHNLQTNETVVINCITGTLGRYINGNSYAVTVTGVDTFTIAVNSLGLNYTGEGYCYSDILPQGDAKYTRIYLGAIAHMHQIEFTLSESQLSDPVKGSAQLEIQGLVVWTRATGMIRG